MDTSIINTGIGAVAGLAQDLIDRAFPDKEKQAEERAQYMLQATQLDDQLAQTRGIDRFRQAFLRPGTHTAHHLGETMLVHQSDDGQ